MFFRISTWAVRAYAPRVLRPYLALAVLATACGKDLGSRPRDASTADATDADLGPDELPCDVATALATTCATCHSSPPSSGAPQALTSRLAFFAQATSVDGQTVAQVALERLHDATRPMPPASEPPADAAAIDAIQTWLEAGAPAGTCGALPAKPLATTCTSGTFWTEGETGSEQMLPGRACRACHQMNAPVVAYYFAGTVFPALHEQDLCDAPPPANARIEILDDATGAVTLTLTPNAAGNFTSLQTSPGVAIPYRARLIAGAVTREMTRAQSSGDCNACHTEQGTHVAPETVDAPGRLVWPAP